MEFRVGALRYEIWLNQAVAVAGRFLFALFICCCGCCSLFFTHYYFIFSSFSISSPFSSPFPSLLLPTNWHFLLFSSSPLLFFFNISAFLSHNCVQLFWTIFIFYLKFYVITTRTKIFVDSLVIFNTGRGNTVALALQYSGLPAQSPVVSWEVRS